MTFTRSPRHRAGLALFVSSVILGNAALATAHALWVSPKPRDQQDGWKEDGRTPGFVLPCGLARDPKQPTTTIPNPNQPLKVDWSETVNHPGCFLIDLSTDDTNFTMLANFKHKATGGTPRAYTTNVMLPAGLNCTGCTIRLRQIMLGSEAAPCPPVPIPKNVTYYSCANIVVSAAGTTDGGAGGTAMDASAKDAGVPDSAAATDTATQPKDSAATVERDSGAAGATGAGGSTGGTAGAGGAADPGDTLPAPKKNSGGCAVGGDAAQPGLVLVLATLVSALTVRRRRSCRPRC